MIIIEYKNSPKKRKSNAYCNNLEKHEKMPVFCCSCGVKILIVPDIPEMNKAIKNHLIEHKRLSGQILTEDHLIQEILSTIIEAINEN